MPRPASSQRRQLGVASPASSAQRRQPSVASRVTDALHPTLVGAPVRIAAQTQGDTTAIVIRVGDAVYTGAGLVVIAIIAILIPLLLPAIQ